MQRIILVGFMGSGKTFIGKKLAEQLNLPFIDSDSEIEQREQLCITDIFRTKGESYFREKEKEFIQSLSVTDNEAFVMAVGGGLPCFNNLMKSLNHLGTTLYLNCTVETLFSRLQNEQTQRPLLHSISAHDLLNHITTKLNERASFYLQSNIIVNEEQQNLKSILDKLHS